MNVRLLAIATILFLVISGCGYNPARDKDCPGCDLNGANLSKVFLVQTNLTDANLNNLKTLTLEPSQVKMLPSGIGGHLRDNGENVVHWRPQ